MADKRRALVLGGGGPMGVAWEAGLAAGLASGGVSLADADEIVGTSAGSIVGAFIAGGDDPVELADDIGHLFMQSVGDSGVDQLPGAGLAGLMETILSVIAESDVKPFEERAVAIGRLALEADTVAEETFVAAIATALDGRSWPEGFSCTAVDTESGEFVRWQAEHGVPLERAVASSCSVPGIYPPITIGGRRYMDGGMRSPLNADLVKGADAVIVISVMMLDPPPGIDDPRLNQFFSAERARVDELREAGADVEVIVPDEEFLNLSMFGMALMDFTRIVPAVEAGTRLGKLEAERLAGIW